jgi:hypothetical protein
MPPESAAELLLRQPPGIPLTLIGNFIDQPGLFAIREDGTGEPIQPRGYEHRFDA